MTSIIPSILNKNKKHTLYQYTSTIMFNDFVVYCGKGLVFGSLLSVKLLLSKLNKLTIVSSDYKIFLHLYIGQFVCCFANSNLLFRCYLNKNITFLLRLALKLFLSKTLLTVGVTISRLYSLFNGCKRVFLSHDALFFFP